MSILSQVACSPRAEEEPPVTDEEVAVLHPLIPAWRIILEEGRRKLCHTYTFDDQNAVREFLRRLEEISLKEGHPAEAEVRGTSVDVTAWTPAIGDLHPNDFLIAAKADGAYTLVVVGEEGEMFTGEALPKLAELPMFRRISTRRAKEMEERRRAS